jgi:hypothetical protein
MFHVEHYRLTSIRPLRILLWLFCWQNIVNIC